jgi:hypothetical protein
VVVDQAATESAIAIFNLFVTRRNAGLDLT